MTSTKPPIARFALVALVLEACPAAPFDDDAGPYVPYDAQPSNPPLVLPAGAPSCAPEAIVDMNARGLRDGRTLRLRVDTRAARDDVHPICAPHDSREVVLRYTVPPFVQADVRAVRITTDSPATDYDTVLSIRLACATDIRDITCDNDSFNADGTDNRRSTVYNVGTSPEDVMFLVVDGYDGSAGIADVVLTELTALGVANAPCFDIPPELLRDPAAPTAYFRCPHDGIRCRPGAAPDGTDLCLAVLPLGAHCDVDGRTNLCETTAECAQNPTVPAQTACALPGTAPGARCRGVRGDDNRCDAGLVCSPGVTMYDRDECVPLRAAGDTCDPAPAGFINQCAPGLRCCAGAPDAGTNTYCVAAGSSPCYQPAQ
jgi:hypothetical protein